MRHIISVLLENEAGALSRVAGLFSARGYNIESLTVAPTEDASLSRMTIVTSGSDEVIEQITKQLNKLIEAVKVVDLSDGDHIERELMLVKVRAIGKDREEMKRMVDIFRGRIIDVTDKDYTIELTGTGTKLDAFLKAIDATAILETVRTGASGLGRGDRQHEHGEDLPGHIVQVGGEGHQVDVHGQQDQLDRHQDDDDVAAVHDDAEHPDGEQDRGDRQIVAQCNGHRSIPDPGLIETLCVPVAGVRATCLPMSWRLTWGLWRKVSTMAPIMATSSTRPAASKK